MIISLMQSLNHNCRLSCYRILDVSAAFHSQSVNRKNLRSRSNKSKLLPGIGAGAIYPGGARAHPLSRVEGQEGTGQSTCKCLAV